MNKHTKKLINITIYEGNKAPEEIVLDNGFAFEMADTKEGCKSEEHMDYDLEIYPPVRVNIVKDNENKWHIRDSIVGILEDDIDFRSPYVSAWLLQEMGYEENLIDVKKRVLLEDEEKGLIIPAFDKDYGTILKFIEGGN
jgi:hypothetical protein